jgi:hypothetical protein
MQDPYAGVFVEQMLGELCRDIGSRGEPPRDDRRLEKWTNTD